MTITAQERHVPAAAGAHLYVLDLAPEERTGATTAVVLSHGAGGCHINWHHQVAHFARDHRVIVWDQRGFGNSRDPRQAASPHQAGQDLLAVLDACGVDRAWMVAQSMAGWGTSLAVRDRPDRFAGVILCDTSAGVVTDDIAARLERFRNDSAASAATGAFYSSLAFDPTWIEQEPAGAAALHLWSRALPATYTSAVADLSATPIPTDHLAHLPVGLIVGERDPIFPPAALREAFSHVADLGIHEIPDAGHSPYLEKPETFNALLGGLLPPP
ncbi:alpha/beta fold hydrolase [Streptomyces sp. AJS327]|uniref:alpha/beta fold hydrolase n=1 Tax=Streptomyces sp. AJS327 TaxID=2545265 RepID=UPI0015DDF7F5|nr:alpha/beta hydrolase [Streptomyces sp. AJS327]